MARRTAQVLLMARDMATVPPLNVHNGADSIPKRSITGPPANKITNLVTAAPFARIPKTPKIKGITTILIFKDFHRP